MSNEPPPILDYQPLNNARRHAVGGLQLLGISITLIFGFLCLALFLNFSRPTGVQLDFLILTTLCGLGIAKVLLAHFVARHNQPAAWTALVLVGGETMALLAFFAVSLMTSGDITFLPVSLLILAGWVAVTVEILRTIITNAP